MLAVGTTTPHHSYQEAVLPILAESSFLHTSMMVGCLCSVWDLSLERDMEEEAEYEAQQKKPQAKAPEDLPPQLLFQHMVRHYDW